jgi:hypothetical protein
MSPLKPFRSVESPSGQPTADEPQQSGETKQYEYKGYIVIVTRQEPTMTLEQYTENEQNDDNAKGDHGYEIYNQDEDLIESDTLTMWGIDVVLENAKEIIDNS